MRILAKGKLLTYLPVGAIQTFLVVLLVNFYLVEGEDPTSKKLESIHRGKRDSSRNKQSRDDDGWAGPSGEDYSSDEPPSKDLEDVCLILKNFVQGMFRLFCLRESKKLEAYRSGKREGYKSDGDELATEDPSSQTHLGTR
nr:hypothetical protein CFP56_59573 [Quercus suber]